MFIDTHCHLGKDDYRDIDEIVNKMEKNLMVFSGADPNYNKEVVDLCEKYDNIYGTLGLHPDQASSYSEKDIQFIEDNLANEKIVGIGEIGLDYYYTNENKQQQINLFKKQLELARKYNKTVVIHSRDAILDTFDVLSDYRDLKIILHCYSGSLEMAKRFITLFNIKFGIGGVVTFKNAQKLQDVVKNIDIKYLLLETDSPYLTPEPYRGQKNEPYNIKIIANKIAEIKNMSYEKVVEETTINARYMYNIR